MGMAATVKKEISVNSFKAIEAFMASAILGNSTMTTTSCSPNSAIVQQFFCKSVFGHRVAALDCGR
jgi:hypothetical protein